MKSLIITLLLTVPLLSSQWLMGQGDPILTENNIKRNVISLQTVHNAVSIKSILGEEFQNVEIESYEIDILLKAKDNNIFTMRVDSEYLTEVLLTRFKMSTVGGRLWVGSITYRDGSKKIIANRSFHIAE